MGSLRVRNRTVLAPPISDLKCHQVAHPSGQVTDWFWTIKDPSDTTDGKVKWDIISTETMTDQSNGLARNRFSDCQHSKMLAARFDPDTFTRQAVTNPGQYLWWDQSLSKGSAAWGSPKYPEQAWNYLGGYTGNVDWFPLIEALGQNVKGLVESKSLLGVTLRELPEAIRMVRNPFGLLKKDWRKYAHNSPAAVLARKGSNLWLEYQYGWKATYSDIKQFIKTAAKYTSSLDRYFNHGWRRYSKMAESIISAPSPTIPDATWDSLRTSVYNGYTGNPHLLARIKYHQAMRKANIGCYATDVLNRQVSSFNKLLYAYGLTGDKLLDTIWEAIPYSFVVDWFVNMDRVISYPRFLDSVRTLQSTNVTRLGYSVKIEMSYDVELFSYVAHSDWWSGTRWLPHLTRDTRSSGKMAIYQRTNGMPPYGVQLWGFQGLNVSQGVSGISLILQKFLGRRT